MLALFIILIIIALLLFFFGGHILIGLIILAPIFLCFYICSKFNLPDFVPYFVALALLIFTIMLISYYKNRNYEKEINKKLEPLCEQVKKMTKNEKLIEITKQKEKISKLEKEFKKLKIDYSHSPNNQILSSKFFHCEHDLDISKKYLKILNK